MGWLIDRLVGWLVGPSWVSLLKFCLSLNFKQVRCGKLIGLKISCLDVDDCLVMRSIGFDPMLMLGMWLWWWSWCWRCNLWSGLIEVMLMSMTAISAIWVRSCLIIPASWKSSNCAEKESCLTSPLAILKTAVRPVRLDVEFELELHLQLRRVKIRAWELPLEQAPWWGRHRIPRSARGKTSCPSPPGSPG